MAGFYHCSRTTDPNDCFSRICDLKTHTLANNDETSPKSLLIIKTYLSDEVSPGQKHGFEVLRKKRSSGLLLLLKHITCFMFLFHILLLGPQASSVFCPVEQSVEITSHRSLFCLLRIHSFILNPVFQVSCL